MIRLGDKVKDSVSGFKGIVTGHARYLTGCDQYLVVAESPDGITISQSAWFNEDQLMGTVYDLAIMKEGIKCD